MFRAAFRSRSIDNPQDWQSNTRSESLRLSLIFRHLEHVFDVLRGLTLVIFRPAFSALSERILAKLPQEASLILSFETSKPGALWAPSSIDLMLRSSRMISSFSRISFNASL